MGRQGKGGGEKRGSLVVRAEGDAVPWVGRMPLASDLGLEGPPLPVASHPEERKASP